MHCWSQIRVVNYPGFFKKKPSPVVFFGFYWVLFFFCFFFVNQLLSLYFTKVRFFAASGIAIMMLVAIYMHVSVGDELIKSMPASVLLVSSLIIAYTEKISSK